MAGAAGLGIAGRNDRPVVRAQRQRLGRPRRADFVKSQSMDVIGRRAPAGLRAGGRRAGGGRASADDLGCATERRTAADLGAIPVRRGRHLRFPFRSVGSDVAVDSVYRAVADTAGKYTLYLLRIVSGGGGGYVVYVENAKTDALECATAQDRKSFSFMIKRLNLPSRQGWSALPELMIRPGCRARRAG